MNVVQREKHGNNKQIKFTKGLIKKDTSLGM